MPICAATKDMITSYMPGLHNKSVFVSKKNFNSFQGGSLRKKAVKVKSEKMLKGMSENLLKFYKVKMSK